MTDDTNVPAEDNTGEKETIAEEDLEAVTGGAGPDSILSPTLGEAGLGEAI